MTTQEQNHLRSKFIILTLDTFSREYPNKKIMDKPIPTNMKSYDFINNNPTTYEDDITFINKSLKQFMKANLSAAPKKVFFSDFEIYISDKQHIFSFMFGTYPDKQRKNSKK